VIPLTPHLTFSVIFALAFPGIAAPPGTRGREAVPAPATVRCLGGTLRPDRRLDRPRRMDLRPLHPNPLPFARFWLVQAISVAVIMPPVSYLVGEDAAPGLGALGARRGAGLVARASDGGNSRRPEVGLRGEEREPGLRISLEQRNPAHEEQQQGDEDGADHHGKGGAVQEGHGEDEQSPTDEQLAEVVGVAGVAPEAARDDALAAERPSSNRERVWC